MTYVDGFVLPVPKDKIEDYRKMAETAGKVWIEHGALEFRECVADDMTVHEGCGVPFPQFANLREGEVVMFSYIVYASREQRDEINKKVMEDPRIKCDPENMPFDVSRMTYGGFKVLVDHPAGAAVGG